VSMVQGARRRLDMITKSKMVSVQDWNKTPGWKFWRPAYWRPIWVAQDELWLPRREYHSIKSMAMTIMQEAYGPPDPR